MRKLCVLALLAMLISCGRSSYTQEDLEGAWRTTDTFVNLHLIFSNDTMWFYSPVRKSAFDAEEARVLDSLSLANDRYKFRLNGDTIEYTLTSLLDLKLDTAKDFHYYKLTIRKLAEDSLMLSTLDWPTQCFL